MVDTTKVLQFWSDASFGSDEQIAAAVYFRQAGHLYKIAMYLGRGSSIEAELFGGILGSCLLSVVGQTEGLDEIVWFSDCKTVISKAQQLEDSQKTVEELSTSEPLWAAWRSTQDKIPCNARYLQPQERGIEHQGCDRASRWVRTKAKRLLKESGEGPIGAIAEHTPHLAWRLIDGQSAYSSIRDGQFLSGLEEITRRLSGQFK